MKQVVRNLSSEVASEQRLEERKGADWVSFQKNILAKGRRSFHPEPPEASRKPGPGSKGDSARNLERSPELRSLGG